MPVALQWHVQSNSSESVALATPRSKFDANDGEVIVALTDVHNILDHNPRVAAAAARVIFDGLDPATSAADPSQRANLAITKAAHLARAFKLDGATADTGPHTVCAIAVVLQQNRLTIARAKRGRVYLLREGHLQNLTDESFSDDAEVDLGQLDLEGDDRILICTEEFSQRVNDLQIRNIMRGQPSARKATQALLAAGGAEASPPIISVAILDYVTGEANAYPVDNSVETPASGKMPRGFVSIPTLVVLAALVIAGALLIPWISGRAASTNASKNATVNAGELSAAAATVVTEATATTVPTTTPIAPAASDTPQVAAPVVAPTDTAAPTSAPAPTETAVPPTLTATVTASPLPTNTPVPPTATATFRPRPTRTPVPPTATPVPPTETPIPPTLPPPPPPSNGGGGGGGGGNPPPPPPPPCPPGATCG